MVAKIILAVAAVCFVSVLSGSTDAWARGGKRGHGGGMQSAWMGGSSYGGGGDGYGGSVGDVLHKLAILSGRLVPGDEIEPFPGIGDLSAKPASRRQVTLINGKSSNRWGEE